jgi:PAS domain S-box-containing protein
MMTPTTRAAPAAKPRKPPKAEMPAKTSLRKRAEHGVGARPPAKEHGARDRLLHELQLREAELQMQNEHLVRAVAELAALHARYHDLYDFAPVAYFTVDSGHRVVELNLAGARMLGGDRGELPGQRLLDYVHATSHAAFERLLARTFAGAELVEEALVMLPRSGRPVYAKAQARRFEATQWGTPQARLVLTDLTALKSANDELARALERFFHYWRP